MAIITKINQAMATRQDGKPHTPQKISFKYLKYTLQDGVTQVERRKGAAYKVSPYKLLINEGNYYLLEADLPGFDKKDIQLDINGDTLTIHAERHSKVEEKDKKDKVIRVERSYGSYSRQFDISAVDAENIKAKYDNGVLQLTLPKKEKVLPEGRRLEIE